MIEFGPPVSLTSRCIYQRLLYHVLPKDSLNSPFLLQIGLDDDLSRTAPTTVLVLVLK